MTHRVLTGLFAAIFSLGAIASAHAGGYIVTNQGYQLIQAPGGQGAYDDGVAQLYGPRQEHVGLGDRDDIVALMVNHNTHYIRPGTLYRSRRPGRIDENHSLLRAQRLWASRHTLPTRVIRRVPLVIVQEDREVRPVLIIMKPQYLRQLEDGRPPRAPMIPAVPRNEKRQDVSDINLMAAAF